MVKTVTLQICLTLAALYGLANVVYTEVSGRGLCSMLRSTRYNRKCSKWSEPAAGSKMSRAICLEIKKIPRQRRNCFKYFTAQNGTWVETCIPGDDSPNDYSEK